MLALRAAQPERTMTLGRHAVNGGNLLVPLDKIIRGARTAASGIGMDTPAELLSSGIPVTAAASDVLTSAPGASAGIGAPKDVKIKTIVTPAKCGIRNITAAKSGDFAGRAKFSTRAPTDA